MSEENKKKEWREREIGALWCMTSHGGEDYYSGSMKINGEIVKVVIFRNKFKQEDNNEPDLRIYKDKEK